MAKDKNKKEGSLTKLPKEVNDTPTNGGAEVVTESTETTADGQPRKRSRASEQKLVAQSGVELADAVEASYKNAEQEVPESLAGIIATLRERAAAAFKSLVPREPKNLSPEEIRAKIDEQFDIVADTTKSRGVRMEAAAVIQRLERRLKTAQKASEPEKEKAEGAAATT